MRVTCTSLVYIMARPLDKARTASSQASFDGRSIGIFLVAKPSAFCKEERIPESERSRPQETWDVRFHVSEGI